MARKRSSESREEDMKDSRYKKKSSTSGHHRSFESESSDRRGRRESRRIYDGKRAEEEEDRRRARRANRRGRIEGRRGSGRRYDEDEDRQGIFERFRGEIDKRVQFLIEGLRAIREAKLTHQVSLALGIDPEFSLDRFKVDPNYLEKEKRYEELKKTILGAGAGALKVI